MYSGQWEAVRTATNIIIDSAIIINTDDVYVSVVLSLAIAIRF